MCATHKNTPMFASCTMHDTPCVCFLAAYTYLSLGCSKAAELRMLAYARSQVGKPFSNSGMARSLFWPRTTDGRSFFCAGTLSRCLFRQSLPRRVIELSLRRPIVRISCARRTGRKRPQGGRPHVRLTDLNPGFFCTQRAATHYNFAQIALAGRVTATRAPPRPRACTRCTPRAAPSRPTRTRCAPSTARRAVCRSAPSADCPAPRPKRSQSCRWRARRQAEARVAPIARRARASKCSAQARLSANRVPVPKD